MSQGPLTWAEVSRFVQQGYGPDEEVRPGLTTTAITRLLGDVQVPAEAELRKEVPLVRRPERDLLMHVIGRRDHQERAPGLLCLHGGGWQGGDHTNYAYMAARAANLGWVAVSATYRLSGQATWPAQLDDVRAALDWMREHARDLGLDPERIAVCGWSAGAHLAAMLALTPEARLLAAVLYYPPCDLAALLGVPGTDDAVRKLLGEASPERLRDASPVARIHPGAPPIFTVIGDRDPITPHLQAVEFHLELGRAGLENELHLLAGRTHGFDFLPDDFQLAWELAVAFLRPRLEVRAASAPADPMIAPSPR